MIGFGSIGGGEVLLILVVALLVFGPRRIPEIGKTIGKTLAEFRKATGEFKSSLEREIEIEKIDDVATDVRDARAELTAVAREVSGIGTAGIEAAIRPPAPEAAKHDDSEEPTQQAPSDGESTRKP